MLLVLCLLLLSAALGTGTGTVNLSTALGTVSPAVTVHNLSITWYQTPHSYVNLTTLTSHETLVDTTTIGTLTCTLGGFCDLSGITWKIAEAEASPVSTMPGKLTDNYTEDCSTHPDLVHY